MELHLNATHWSPHINGSMNNRPFVEDTRNRNVSNEDASMLYTEGTMPHVESTRSRIANIKAQTAGKLDADFQQRYIHLGIILN